MSYAFSMEILQSINELSKYLFGVEGGAGGSFISAQIGALEFRDLAGGFE